MEIRGDVKDVVLLDVTHFKQMFSKIKTIKPTQKFSFVLDRGYFSSDNINNMIKKGDEFMIMLPKTES